MARTRFVPDHSLTGRMVFVVFLLGLLYVSVIAGLIAFTNVSSIAILVVAAGFLLAQWYWSDKLALMAMGAREVDRDQAPELHALVDRMVALADMPKPRIAISYLDMPNAFATGRNPSNAVLCVTDGLMRRLRTEELEGVIAHELSHIAHRDVAVMTVASFLGVVAGLIFRFGVYFGGGGRSNNNNAVPVFAIIWLGSIAVYVISFLLTRALSRYREFAADRAAAYLTGNPSSLASALTKITGDTAKIPTRDLRKTAAASAFFFAPAAVGRSLSGILSTHPPTEKRIQKLAEISAQLGRPF